MIDHIQFPSPHVHIEDYSHIMVVDEVMLVEIVVKSMMMMKRQNPPLRSEDGDQSGPEILVFDGDCALVREKLCAPRVRVFSYIRRLAKGLVERGREGQTAFTTWPEGGPLWCTLFGASWAPGLCIPLRFFLFHENFCSIFPNLFPKFPA
jgi:hypothetical protein